MTEEDVRNTLQNVDDPEVGVNIVDLGLVYTVDLDPDTINIQMTMTSPTCPLHAIITRNVETALRENFPQVHNVNIKMVWEPPWEPSMMSPDAKQILGW